MLKLISDWCIWWKFHTESSR